MRFQANCGRVLLVALGVAVLQACVAPVPAPTRTSAPPELKNKIDTQFIEQGRTTRQQVEEKLGWSSIDLGEDKVFWGRWSTSSSAIVWAIGGYGAADVGGNRHWSVKNMLIEFDENGVVRSSRILSDGDIAQRLRPLLTPKAGGFDTAVALYVDHAHAGKKDIVTLEFQRDHIKYTEPEANKGKGRVFEIPSAKLTGVSIPTFRTSARNPDQIWFTLHFSEKTPAGKDVTFTGGPDDLATILRYQNEIAQSKSK